MADEMDPCECLWNHELAMRRLISLLRSGQSYCTEQDCLEPTALPPGPTSAGGNYLMLFMTLAVAVAMYALRPRRNNALEATKPERNSSDRDDGAPPAPPRV